MRTKTIKANVRENLEQLSGASMATLTMNKQNNQCHFYSEENFIEQHTKSKKTGDTLKDVWNCLLQVLN